MLSIGQAARPELRCVMKFFCRISEKEGGWIAEHASADIGPIRVTAPTRDEALRKIEGEIRYWLEMCPCTGETYRNIAIEAVDAG
jgi:hypothetical protein